MTLSSEILDELLTGVDRAPRIFRQCPVDEEAKIRLMERMLGAELTAHLRYEEGKEAPAGRANAMQPHRLVPQPLDARLAVAPQRENAALLDREHPAPGRILRATAAIHVAGLAGG